MFQWPAINRCVINSSWWVSVTLMWADCVVVAQWELNDDSRPDVSLSSLSVWPHYFSGHWHVSSSSFSAALFFIVTLHSLRVYMVCRRPDLVWSIWTWTVSPFVVVIEPGKVNNCPKERTVCACEKRTTSLGCVGYALYKGQRCLRCHPFPINIWIIHHKLRDS